MDRVHSKTNYWVGKVTNVNINKSYYRSYDIKTENYCVGTRERISKTNYWVGRLIIQFTSSG